MNNPLLIIADWFDNQKDRDIQLDLVGLVAHFHLDSTIELERDNEKKIDKFKNYLTDEDLSDKEVIQRSIFMRGLISSMLDGRDTEEGWELSKSRIEAVSERMPDTGIDTLNSFMNTYEHRKITWIAWSNSWKALIDSDLADRNLFDWYFSESTNKMRKPFNLNS